MVDKKPGAGKLDPRGPNKFEPEEHETFPEQENYPAKPGSNKKPQSNTGRQ